MANLFYGTCDTGADEKVKIVSVANGTTIEEGDLLIVYFANGNTNESPNLSIENLSSDEGYAVKKRNVTESLKNAWKDGEVVGFVKVKQEFNTDNDAGEEDGATDLEANNATWWELFEGGQATVGWYGMTKLFDVLDNMPPDNWPHDAAATPALVEWVYNQIPKDEDGNVITKIEYITDSEDKQPNEQGRFRIYYNQDSTPIEYIIYDTNTEYERTSQFINDASDPQKHNVTTDGGYYITNTLDGNFYLTGNLYRDFPNNTPKGLITVSNNYIDYGSGFPNLNGHVFGQNVYIGATGKTSYAANDGSFRVPYGDIYEYGGTENHKLRNRYNPKLSVKRFISGNLTYEKNSQSPRGSDTAHLDIIIDENGWEPICIVGWNISRIDSSVSSADAGYMNIWEAFIIQGATEEDKPVIRFALRNLDTNKARSANVTFYVLGQTILNP